MATLRKVVLVVVLAGLPAMGMAAVLAWGAGGANDDWDTCENWALPCCPSPPECYPSEDTETAQVPNAESAWTINIISEEIDTLLVLGDVDFGAAASTPQLTVTTFRVDAEDSNGNIVTISDATITNAPS